MFRPASSKIAQTCGSRRPGCRAAVLPKIIGSAAIALLASANTFANSADNAPRAALDAGARFHLSIGARFHLSIEARSDADALYR